MSNTPQFEHTQYDLMIDDIQIRYWDEGLHHPLLLLHGIGSSKEYWAWIFHHWATHHRVIALDIPGYGESSVPSTKNNSFHNLAAASELVRQVNEQLNVRYSVLIGHSMGSGIALQYAMLYPEEVAGLVLISPMGLGREIDLFSKILILPLIGELLFRPTRSAIRKILSSDFPTEGIEDLVEITYRFFRRKGAIAWHLYLMRQGIDLRGQKFQFEKEELKKLNVPTLIITGQNDLMFPIFHAQRGATVIPDSRLHILENVEHNPHIERPDLVTKLVSDFLQEIGHSSETNEV